MPIPVIAAIGAVAVAILKTVFKKIIISQLKKRGIFRPTVKIIRESLLKELKSLLRNVPKENKALSKNIEKAIKWLDEAPDEEIINLLDPVGAVIERTVKTAGDEIGGLCRKPELGKGLKLEGEPIYNNGNNNYNGLTPEILHEAAQSQGKGIPMGTIIRGRNYTPNPILKPY